MQATGEFRLAPRRGAYLVSRIARAIAAIAITACLLAAGVLILLPALGRALGHPTVVVTTGSMTPSIRPGDAIILEEVSPSEIEVGDAITYGTPSQPGLITHRVVSTLQIQGTTYFQTKGDANRAPDPDLTPAAVVRGRVRWTIPQVGSLLVHASSRWGALLLLGVPALLLFVQEALAFRTQWRRAGRGTAKWMDPSARR